MSFYKYILKAFLLWQVFIILAILGIFILGIALLFIKKDKEVLPKFLRWYDNGEGYFKGADQADGLMGPDYYRKQRNIADKSKLSFLRIYCERFNWLVLRNPVNYFKYAIMGLHVKDKLTLVFEDGKPHIGNDPGLHRLIVKNGDGKEYFEWYGIFKYPFIKYGFRLRIGHKIKDISDDKDGKVIPFVFAPTPFKKLDL